MHQNVIYLPASTNYFERVSSSGECTLLKSLWQSKQALNNEKLKLLRQNYCEYLYTSRAAKAELLKIKNRNQDAQTEGEEQGRGLLTAAYNQEEFLEVYASLRSLPPVSLYLQFTRVLLCLNASRPIRGIIVLFSSANFSQTFIVC